MYKNRDILFFGFFLHNLILFSPAIKMHQSLGTPLWERKPGAFRKWPAVIYPQWKSLFSWELVSTTASISPVLEHQPGPRSLPQNNKPDTFSVITYYFPESNRDFLEATALYCVSHCNICDCKTVTVKDCVLWAPDLLFFFPSLNHRLAWEARGGEYCSFCFFCHYLRIWSAGSSAIFSFPLL